MDAREMFVVDYCIAAFLLAIKGDRHGATALRLTEFYLAASWGVTRKELIDGGTAVGKYIDRFFKNATTDQETSTHIQRLIEGVKAHDTQKRMLFSQLCTLACLDADVTDMERNYLNWIGGLLDLRPSEIDTLFEQGALAQNALVNFIDVWNQEEAKTS